MRGFTLLVFLAGCYQENLAQVDISGKVVLPRAAATRTIPLVEADGTVNGTTEVTDPRLIGPVYLGAYSGIDTDAYDFPYPAMGPVIGGEPGNSFPYGATTIGRFDFACYEFLACKVTTGRFADYNDIIDYFANVLATPVVDPHGVPVGSGSEFQQRCYDYYNVTSDKELSFLSDLDFVENADGDFEAEYLMPHTTFVEGMSLWGFMDSPTVDPVSPGNNGVFSSCNLNSGRQYVEYDQDFYEGSPYTDVVNVPSYYVRVGDWVADGTTTMTSPDEVPTIHLTVPLAE